MNNFQRDGSTSNSHVGRAFEARARKVLAEHGVRLESGHKVPCGLGTVRKNHAFDLGSGSPKVIVECKSHTWTSGGNVPSAKMKNWAEAMFYFHMAPPDYRKIFFVERSVPRSPPRDDYLPTALQSSNTRASRVGSVLHTHRVNHSPALALHWQAKEHYRPRPDLHLLQEGRYCCRCILRQRYHSI